MQINLSSLVLIGGYLALASPSQSAINLVPNGDFESGLADFTSDYLLADGSAGSLIPESRYIVGPDPNLYHGSFASYGDHTSGSGNMLIVNGSTNTTDIVWNLTAPIAVTPNTNYFFEAWLSTAVSASPGILSFELDGDTSDTTLGSGTAPATTGIWEPVSLTWNSGANTSVQLSLQNANPAFGGNDFAVDDIYFGVTSSVNPPPPSVPEGGATLPLFVVLLGGLGPCFRRRH